MRRSILLLLAFAGALGSAPTISNIATVRTSHSTVTLRFVASSVGSKYRVRYGLTTNYEAEGGCTPLLECGIQELQGYDANAATNLEAKLGGLSPDTEYHFCPQVSDDGGSTWSTCVDHTTSTEAVPAGAHPAYPTAPTAVDTTRPDTSGYDVRAVASDCSDLQSKINAAAANQYVNGSIVTIPAGTVCTGLYTLKAPGTPLSFSAANVNTATGRITITGHGLSDGAQAFVAAWQPPGSVGWDDKRQHRGPVPWGAVSYVRVHDVDTISFSATADGATLPFTTTTLTADDSANTLQATRERFVPENGNTVQLVGADLPDPLAQNTTYYVRDRSLSGRTFKLAATSEGAAIDLNDAGSGTFSLADQGGGGYLIPWPPPEYWIIIRTATADSEFVPEGVRVTSEFQSKMATIRTSNRDLHAVTNDDLAVQYRFEGIEFTHTDTATAEIGSTMNPKGFDRIMYLRRNAARIIIDRSYIHGLGAPNRVWRAIAGFDPRESAIINSAWDRLDYWTPVRDGLTLTRNSNTEFTIAAGTFHLPSEGSATVGSTVTVTTSGSATETGRVYFSMAGALTLDLPTGISASCSPDVCTVVNNASPTYAVDGDGRATVMPIGNLTFSGSALTAVAMQSLLPDEGFGTAFQDKYEGATSFLAGAIGGRTALINNSISSSGLVVHYDDNDSNQAPPSEDHTIRRNLFTVPLSQIWSRPESDGLRYGMRQQLEFKRGIRIKVTGNIFEGVFADSTAVATGITVTPTPGINSHVSDLEIGYNLFRNGAGGLAIDGGRTKTGNADTSPPNAPLQRVWVHNNLVHSIDQYTYRAHTGANALGVAIDHRHAFEDSIWERNTFHDARGTMPAAALFAGPPHEGMIVRNNIFWINDALLLRSDECVNNTPACSGDGDTLLASLSFNDVWTNNSFIAGWTDYTGNTARSSKTYLTDAMASQDAYLQSELPGDIEWADAAAGDFRLIPGISHRSGGAKRASDGRDRGVDYDKLRQEIGEIYNQRALSITSSGATIYATVPDPGAACYVGYGTTSAPSAWTWTAANTAASRVRGIALSGLSTATEYHYRLVCAGTSQPATGTFTTQ